MIAHMVMILARSQIRMPEMTVQAVVLEALGLRKDFFLLFFRDTI